MSNNETRPLSDDSDDDFSDGWPWLRDSRGNRVSLRDVTQHQPLGGPPYWTMRVDDKVIRVTSRELSQQCHFKLALLEQTGRLLDHQPPSLWRALVADLTRDAAIVYEEVPRHSQPDYSPVPQHPQPDYWPAITEAIEDMRAAESIADLVLNGGRYERDGLAWFASQEILAYLEGSEVVIKPRTRLYALLKLHGGRGNAMTVQGKFRNIWSLPWPLPNQELATPTDR